MGYICNPCTFFGMCVDQFFFIRKNNQSRALKLFLKFCKISVKAAIKHNLLRVAI